MFSTKDYTLDSRGNVGAGYVQKVLMYHVLHQGLHPGQQGDVGAGYVQSTHVSCSPPRITPWTAGRCWGRVRTKYSCIMFSTKDYTLDSRGDVGAGYVQSTHVSCSPPRITPWTVGAMLGQGTYKVLMYHVLHQGLHPGQQG